MTQNRRGWLWAMLSLPVIAMATDPQWTTCKNPADYPATCAKNPPLNGQCPVCGLVIADPYVGPLGAELVIRCSRCNNAFFVDAVQSKVKAK